MRRHEQWCRAIARVLAGRQLQRAQSEGRPRQLTGSDIFHRRGSGRGRRSLRISNRTRYCSSSGTSGGMRNHRIPPRAACDSSSTPSIGSSSVKNVSNARLSIPRLPGFKSTVFWWKRRTHFALGPRSQGRCHSTQSTFAGTPRRTRAPLCGARRLCRVHCWASFSGSLLARCRCS